MNQELVASNSSLAFFVFVYNSSRVTRYIIMNDSITIQEWGGSNSRTLEEFLETLAAALYIFSDPQK
jgi:hypothetical protein